MYYSTLLKFYECLNESDDYDLTMGIGISVLNPIDTERNLFFNITMSEYLPDDIVKLIEYSNKKIILNYDFNSFCVINTKIIEKFNKINKIKSIVFDSSTFKFLRNIKFLASLYYLTLETNGSIYIESNSPFSIGSVISNLRELDELLKKNKGGFCYQFAFILLNHMKNLVPINKIEEVEKSIILKNEVYTKNLDFLQKWFYGSHVELLENEDYTYPITNPRYEIKKYYKITKIIDHNEILEYVKVNINEINKALELNSVIITDKFAISE